MEAQLRDLVDRPFLGSEKHREQYWRADRVGMPPDLYDFERRLLARMAKHGVPMFTHCCVRGRDEQERLFARGFSKARFGQSAHNFGMAIDVVHGVKAWDMTRDQWAIIGHIGKELALQSGVKVRWGGDWEFYDPAHWELSDWRKRQVGLEPLGV